MYSNKFHNTDLSDKSILITGGAGFIGSHLVEYLMKQQVGKLIVVDDLSTGYRSNIEEFEDMQNFRFVEDTINDTDLMTEICQEVDYVFHQAAIGSVPRSIEFPLLSHHSNATGFLSILEACRKAGVKQIVYASSSSVYGDSKELPKTEDVIGNPKSPYAITKLMDAYYATLYSRLHGMNITGLRYFNIFGPRQSPNGPYAAAIPLFILATLEGDSPIIYGNGEQSRDFTFVLNAVKANMLAMFSESSKNGQVYNVACGQQYSLNQVLEMLSELNSSEVKAVYKNAREGDIMHSMADIGKISSELNFSVEVQMKEGISLSYNWYKKHYQNSRSNSIGQ